MKFNETEASQCRYGHIASALFEGYSILWEDSHADYQGSAKVLGARGNEDFIFYEWSYGSCSGCDTWEASNMGDEEILQEMRHTAARFTNFEHVIEFFSKRKDQEVVDKLLDFERTILRIREGNYLT